ncbi:hypothetical protein [Mycobacterium paraintracellulare]|uniref:hypothetical protein n=1 Tax=Mycobacterium paraintracellulare TaxID=1138383 RepID=UPI0019278AAC|nr:hypothetical protein [Mycobacterium paraintracellulare]BCP14278.1 hypothetical protein MINTM021_11870 [Mycobacterium paraintracellulare]
MTDNEYAAAVYEANKRIIDPFVAELAQDKREPIFGNRAEVRLVVLSDTENDSTNARSSAGRGHTVQRE